MLTAEDLTKDWVAGTLDPGTIHTYLTENFGAHKLMSDQALEHVVRLCHLLFAWSVRKSPLGSFLQAVVKNDLSEAVHTADDVNRRHLWIYPAFLYNVAPHGWKDEDEKTT